MRARKNPSKSVILIVIVLILLGLFLLHRTQQAGGFHAPPERSRPR
jgi:hypothetical protein